MRKNTFLWIVMLLSVLFSVGCQAGSILPGGEKQAQKGAVLFKDDFSNPGSGWDTWSNAGADVSYADGALRFVVNDTQYDYWSRPGKRFSDVRIAVEARLVDGPSDNDYGIICRYKDQNNFYAFLISSDGYSGILKVKDGSYTLISGDTMTFHDEIRKGNSINYLGADCSGSSLNLYANGSQLASVQDTDFPSGEVGLLVGSYNQPGVEIRFDNFVVTKY
jgi:hypothetical protein